MISNNIIATPHKIVAAKQLNRKQSKSIVEMNLNEKSSHSTTSMDMMKNQIEITHSSPIPERLLEKQKIEIDRAIKFITSKDYYQTNVIGRNWKDPNYVEELKIKIKDPEYLKNRAHTVLSKAIAKLGEYYGDKEIISIPWSGGKDSSGILALSALYYPEKTYELLTVVNGMFKPETIPIPKKQVNTILKHLGIERKNVNIKHHYIDMVKETKEHVINSAKEDKAKLNCPGVCSSCKTVLEMGMAKAAKQLDSDTLTLGYVKYQGIQGWIDQVPEQTKFLENELAKEGIQSAAPLYDVIEYPFDAVLLLSAMGVPLEDHKHEMLCSAEGMNPDSIDTKKLTAFLTEKTNQVRNSLPSKINLVNEIPNAKVNANLTSDVEKLKQDKEYLKGSYIETFEEDTIDDIKNALKK